MAEEIIHLDTSFLIRVVNANSDEDRKLRRWIGEGANIGMSATAWTEFLCGPLDDRQLALATTIIGEPVSFVADDSIQTAELFNRSGRRRGSLLDCMIAAVAVRVNAGLATSNYSDFRRFPNLRLM